MKFQVGNGKLICIFLLTLAAAASSQNIKCPFNKLYHFGDGFTDIGNAIHVDPTVSVPARLSPYGVTYPGWPTGRWGDGLIDFDFTARDLGLPNIVPYLTWLATPNNDGVIFSVARSPVLSRSFFKSRGIEIPSYAVPLEPQINWFKDYLKSVCNTTEACAEWNADAHFLMGDIEGNDIAFALTQGKSVEEVKTYVPDIVKEIIAAARELINLGARRLAIPGNVPVGCYPYILTELRTRDTEAYDELGCLKAVNELVQYKNAFLEQAVTQLAAEYPGLLIGFAGLYDGVISVIRNYTDIGPDGVNKALKSCCGIGGRYNYDSKRMCGSPGVPVCSNPSDFIYWDGLHFAQQVYYKVEHMSIANALIILSCNETSPSVTSVGASPPSASICDGHTSESTKLTNCPAQLSR